MGSSKAALSAEDEKDVSKPAKRQRKVSFYVDTGVDPSSCIFLRLVSSAEEMTEFTVGEFTPDFTEHLFGEDGKIFGYKDLKVVIWVHALSFHVHIEILYSEKLQATQQATDLDKVFKEALGPGLIEDRDAFLQSLSLKNRFSDVLHQHGKRVACFSKVKDQDSGYLWGKVDNGAGDVGKEILLLDLSTAEIKEWNLRLTPLLLMFVEAGRPIEQKDPHWEVFVNLEKVSSEPESVWRLVGLCLVYNFFKYPDSTRLRLSQILVLPPYQGQRNGLHLLEAVNQVAVERNCYEVTMEEPSESLQELRDSMDVLRMLSFEPARSHLPPAVKKMVAIQDDHKHFEWCMPTLGLVEAVRKSLKISKGQLQRCWDVLLFLHLRETNLHAEQMFKKLVAWRMNIELFGKPKRNKVDENKQIVDTDNPYNSPTFVMFKTRSSTKQEEPKADDCRVVEFLHSEDAGDSNGKANMEKELEELITEREEEITRVAEKVRQHLTLVGTSLVSWS